MNKILKYAILMPALLWAVGYAFFVFHVHHKSSHINIHNADAIIVLTGGQNRIDTALQIFANAKTDKLFITGVHKDVSKDDILNMWDGETPLKKCCIILGRQAKTTRGNALEAQKWLEQNQNIKTITLVTSSYHMDRALLEFHNTLKGHNIEIAQYPVTDPQNALNTPSFWKLTFSEYNKLIFRSIILLLANKG